MNPRYRGELKARLEKACFDQRFRTPRARTERLLNEVFAHLDWNIVLGVNDLGQKNLIDRGELRECSALLRQLQDALSIGSRNLFLPVEHVSTSLERDIEEILRLIAQASDSLRMPKQNSLFSNIKRETPLSRDPSKLRILNEYGKMLDPPEI